jgi:hypothetical protein
MSDKPNYISYPGEFVMRPSFQLNATQIYSFILEGDKDKLQKTLDIRLNGTFANSGLRYKPLGSDVFFTFSVTANGHSNNAVSEKEGYILEDEIAFWMPIVEEKRIAGKWVANRLALFIPFIFVNNPFALVAGREVYGFPKTIGSFSIPASVHYADAFTVDTMSFAKFSPNAPLINNRLLKVSRPPITVGDSFSTEWTSDKDVTKVLYKNLKKGLKTSLLKGLDGGGKSYWLLIKNLIKDIKNLEMPAVFLKQFRSAQDDDKAVYQALIDSGFKVNGFHGGGLLHGDYTLSLTDNDSFPLHDTLGLTDGQKVKLAFWVNVDFENVVGTELFVN